MATFTAEVSDYDPRELQHLAGGLGWEVDRARAALLVHDMLPYYLQILAPTVRGRVIDGAEQVVAWSRRHSLPLLVSGPRPAQVIAQRGIGGQLWGLGPSAAEAVDSGLPTMRDRAVTRIQKRSLSAFYSTDLETELRRLRRDQLIVVGVYASAGVLATAFDALARDVEVIVVADATADYTQRRHESALELLRGLGQVTIHTDL